MDFHLTSLAVFAIDLVVGTLSTGFVYAWIGGAFDLHSSQRRLGRYFGVSATVSASSAAVGLLGLPPIAYLMPFVLSVALMMGVLGFSVGRVIGAIAANMVAGAMIGVLTFLLLGLGQYGVVALFGLLTIGLVVVVTRSQQNAALRRAWDEE